MRIRANIAVLVSAFGLVLAGTAPASAAPAVRIIKIRYNTPGPDLPVSAARLNGEYVVVKNTSTRTQVLTRWTLRDASNHVYTFPATALAPGKSITVRTGPGKNTSTTRYWGKRYYVWNNSGRDTARLNDATGRLVSACTYTGTAAGNKVC